MCLSYVGVLAHLDGDEALEGDLHHHLHHPPPTAPPQPPGLAVRPLALSSVPVGSSINPSTLLISPRPYLRVCLSVSFLSSSCLPATVPPCLPLTSSPGRSSLACTPRISSSYSCSSNTTRRSSNNHDPPPACLPACPMACLTRSSSLVNLAPLSSSHFTNASYRWAVSDLAAEHHHHQ